MINTRGYSFDKTEPCISDLRKDLIVKPMNYDIRRKKVVKSESDKFSVYRESSKRIYIPRAYAIKKFGLPTTDLCSERMIHIDDDNSHFNGTLREHQVQSISEIKEQYDSIGSCILCLPCGYGKTCVAINMIHTMKLKTLIIVHKEFLMTQWVERLKEFLPNSRIGYIQQNKCDIQDKDVVVGMLQSVASREYENNTFDGFGQLIVDECHHIAARAFSNAMFKIQCKYMLGLSATPDRQDGLTIILNWFFGKVICPITRPKNYTVNIDILRTKNIMELNNDRREKTISTLVTYLASDIERNKMLLDKIVSVKKECPLRKIIVLSDRREHLALLKTQIDRRMKNDVSCGLYIGGMKKADLKESENCDIILSTFSMTSEGFDIPTLNTLFLTTPKSNIEQSVGRILRKSSEISPLVVDIYDNHSLLEGMYRKRIRFYKKNGYSVDYGDDKGRIRQQQTSLPATKNKKLDEYSFIDVEDY